MTTLRRSLVLAATLGAAVTLTASAVPAGPGNGSIVVASPGGLVAVDPETGIETDLGPGAAPSWSPAGTRLAFLDSGSVAVMNGDGTNLRRLGTGSADRRPVWSPDGRRLAFVSGQPGATALVVVDADTGERRELARGASITWRPAWSPDGTRIAYTRESGSYDLAVVNADGTGDRLLSGGPGLDAGPTWSPEGSLIAFLHATEAGPAVHVVAPDGGPIRRLSQTGYYGAGATGAAPAWSPDGTSIAFTGTTRLEYYRYGFTEYTDVYVVDADGLFERRLTASTSWTGNTAPIWSPDGRRIAFESTREGGVYQMNADGTCETRVGKRIASAPTWQPVASAPPAPRIRCADLELSAPNERGAIALAGSETIHLTILNRETEPATGVRLTAPHPDGAAFVTGSTARGACAVADGAVTCDVGSLQVGETTTVDLVARAERLGLVRAQATVTANEPDGNRANNVSQPWFEVVDCETVGTYDRDDLVGTAGVDSICALGGADRIRALGGADQIDAGGGPDRVYPGPGRDVVALRAGDDLVDARDGERDTIVCGGESDIALVDPVDATDRTCEVVVRSQLRCSTLGTIRADEIVGTSRTDRGDSICSLAGNDTIRADKGADSVDGGAGNDTIIGGPGGDLLLGGAGYDTIQARDGTRDRVRCGPNFDVVLADNHDRVARDCERVQRR
jgi:Tol biopolymer transport system component